MQEFETTPDGTKRPDDIHLWSYFGQDVSDHNRSKIGGIRFLTYFGSAIYTWHRKISLKTYFMDND